MAEQKSPGAGAAKGASRTAEAPFAKKAAPRRRKIEAGGHTIYADVEPASAPPIETCNICGQVLVDHECPDHGGDRAAGWGVPAAELTPREAEAKAKAKEG